MKIMSLYAKILMVPKQALLSSETQPTTDREFRDNVIMHFITFYDCLKYNDICEIRMFSSLYYLVE